MRPLRAIPMQARADLPGHPVLCSHGSAVDEAHLSSPFTHPEKGCSTGCASLWHLEHKHTIQGASLPPVAPQRPFIQLSTSISTATATAMTSRTDPPPDSSHSSADINIVSMRVKGSKIFLHLMTALAHHIV